MLILFIIVLLCLAGTAFFAGIETGVISIHRVRLRHHVEQGEAWAVILDDFLAHPDKLLGTTLVGTNLCMILASVLVAGIGVRLGGSAGEIILGILITLVVLVFCEYLPKAWFQSEPMQRCRPFAGLLRVSWLVLRPLSAMITWLTNWIVPGSPDGRGQTGRYAFITKDELKVLAEEGQEHGLLSPRQKIMIHRVMELAAKTASQVMIPRARMTVTDAGATVDAFLSQAQQAGFTRLPVYDAAARKFVGIVNMFEPLAEERPTGDRPVAEFMRPPQFVPDTTPITEILPRLRRARQPMVLVTDAQSEVVGMITTEDIVREIVGKV